MADATLWHDLLGLIFLDYFGDSCRLESEKDLSLKKQLLDFALVLTNAGPLPDPLPDGLTPLAPHNLLTFKSFQETFSPWTFWELGAHFVNYRKQVSPSTSDLLPEEHFRLFALATRYPEKASKVVPMHPVQQGVYDCPWGGKLIRLIVLHDLPLVEHNALLLLFSALPEQVAYAVAHYQRRSTETSTLLDQLVKRYRTEGLPMPMTKAEFKHYYLKDNLTELTPEERMAGLAPEERLRGLPPEERLKGLPPEELLKGLSPEAIRAYLERLDKGGAPPT